jgi:hypothetical protein
MATSHGCNREAGDDEEQRGGLGDLGGVQAYVSKLA